MARNDTRANNTDLTNHANLRAPAASWQALVSVMVASTLVVAIAVSAFALLDAVFSGLAFMQTQRPAAQAGAQRWRAPTRQPLQTLNLPRGT